MAAIDKIRLNQLSSDDSSLSAQNHINDISKMSKKFDDSWNTTIVTRSGRQVRPTADDPSLIAALTPTANLSKGSELQLEALFDACEEESDRIATKRALDEAKVS